MTRDANDILRDEGLDALRSVVDRRLAEAPMCPGAPETDNTLPRSTETPNGPRPKIRATPFRWIEPSSIPVRQWIYDRHHIRRYVSVTLAASGVGKSSLSIVEALAITTGRSLLGIAPAERTNVWLWNGEDPIDELQRRVAAAALHYRIAQEEFQSRLFLDSGRLQQIVIARQEGRDIVSDTNAISEVIETLRAKQIGVLCIDPYVSAHRVNENDNGAMDLVAKLWGRIADSANCAVEIVHHTRKTGGQESTVEDSRGASALIAAARSVRVLNGMTEAEAAKAGVESRRLYFRKGNGKSNLAPPSDASVWFKLESVPLGNGPLGTDGDWVGVVTRWEWPDPFADLTLRDLRAVQLAVSKDGPWRENAQAEKWVGRVVARVLDLDIDDKADRARVKALLQTWIKNGMLKVVEGVDEGRNTRKFIEVATWCAE